MGQDMNWQVIKNRVAKIFIYTGTGVIFLFVSSFLVLQMPPVQDYFIGKFLRAFTEKTGFTTSIESFRMMWFDRLELENVSVYDLEQNEMIRAQSILINFKLAHLLYKKNVNIDGVFVDSAHVFLTKINESDSSRDLNINVFIANINASYSGSGSGGRSPKVNIGEAFVNRSQFTFINQDRDSIKQGFDYDHFSIVVDEAQLNSFVILGDTTEFNVNTLIAQDVKTKFKVHQISTFFRVCQQSMEFRDIDLHAGESIIADQVVLSYEHLRDLNDIINKVTWEANLINTTIDPYDLAHFVPGIERLGQPVNLEGTFKGMVSNFKFTKMKIDLGRTHLAGSLDMDGLPDFEETFMVISLRNSIVDPTDLSFLFNDNTLQRLQPMGLLTMDGQFLGYPTDFVANGNFAGLLGTIKSDINFKVNDENIDRSEYSGSLALIDFKLGAYLGDTINFQGLNMAGKIKGSGLTKNLADFRLDGRIDNVGLKGYNYRNITTDARFAAERFNGSLVIDDPNLRASLEGYVDLREGQNLFNIRASLDTAFLHRLNLSRDSIFIRADLVADTRGLTLDSLTGIADFRDFNITYNNQSLHLSTIHLNAQQRVGERSIVLETSLADARIIGEYYLSDLYANIRTLAREIGLNIRNDEAEIEEYYGQKSYKPRSHEANFTINLKDVEPFVNLLNIDLKLSPNTVLQGTITSGYTTIFKAYTSVDSLEYKGNLFLNTEIDLTASKIADSTSVLAMASVISENQSLSPALKTKNLLVEAIWDQNHIDFGLDADHENQSNYVRLKGSVDFLHDSTVIAMEPSSLQLLERQWKFVPDNYLSIKGSTLHFHDVALTHEEQSVGVAGYISEDPSEKLALKVEKLDLSLLNVLTNKKFSGIVDASVELSNYYRQPLLENNLQIRDLTVNDFLVGDISGKNEWDTLRNQFTANLYIDRLDKRIVNLVGSYNPRNQRNGLDVIANLEQANLKILEPFLEDIFSNIGGTVSGQFSVTGPLNAPEFRGEGNVLDGQIMINYMKTLFLVKGIIGLTPNTIYFKDMDLTDTYRNKGSLNGTITHEAFARMSIDLNANFTNFQVLNTSARDNDLFYGQAYATGNVRIDGPIANLRIASSARTEKNTRIYIPISGSTSTGQQEFINFVNFTDTTITKTVTRTANSNKVNLTGLTFDLNLDVTPDAYCEIIFDIKSGDIIRGRGNGDLRMQIDTKGEFNMFGPFEFTEGWYNFTLYDVINKEFEIKRGSTITWIGDPYEGVLNIDASYNQLASFMPIIPNLSEEQQNSPQLRRKYPAEVLLYLDGPMLTPELTFDINAYDLPKSILVQDGGTVNLDLQFAAFKNRLDEQELKRQVFSLIVLRRFSPPESFNTSGSVVSSLSELLSNQLSYWMSQVDENLEIDVDIASMDQESFNTFQLRFSYTFLDGRLRVTGDGTFNNTSNQPTTTAGNPSSVAGDWTVDYMLTADGKLRVKMYSRTNVNPIQTTSSNQTAMTTGASIIHTQSFDQLRDIFTSARKNKNQNPQGDTIKPEALKEEDGSE
jgi:hypothetical protein